MTDGGLVGDETDTQRYSHSQGTQSTAVDRQFSLCAVAGLMRILLAPT